MAPNPPPRCRRTDFDDEPRAIVRPLPLRGEKLAVTVDVAARRMLLLLTRSLYLHIDRPGSSENSLTLRSREAGGLMVGAAYVFGVRRNLRPPPLPPPPPPPSAA